MEPQHSKRETKQTDGDPFLLVAAPEPEADELLNLNDLKQSIEYAALVSLLQKAYSGEKAAALAYQGHAKSVSDPTEKLAIQQIERDEWEHRRDVGEMLSILGSRPTEWREFGLGIVGHTASALCHVTGWYMPMYFAGKLETSNVEEYTTASQLADKLGLEEMAVRLKEMADTEKRHEEFFRKVLE